MGRRLICSSLQRRRFSIVVQCTVCICTGDTWGAYARTRARTRTGVVLVKYTIEFKTEKTNSFIFPFFFCFLFFFGAQQTCISPTSQLHTKHDKTKDKREFTKYEWCVLVLSRLGKCHRNNLLVSENAFTHGRIGEHIVCSCAFGVRVCVCVRGLRSK